jgi:uncharacterized membrane protein
MIPQIIHNMWKQDNENTRNENNITYNYDDNYFTSILEYIKNYYKQILLFILAIITIIAVEKLHLYNSLKFGAVNFIPGMPNPSPNIPMSIVPKKKRNKK